MNELAGLFLNSLLPILLAAAAGYPLGRFLKVNPRSFSQVIFYIFSPCLVFRLLTTTQLAGVDILRISGVAVLVAGVILCLAYFLGRLANLDRPIIMAVMLSSMLMNAGNFGLPLNSFAFGQQALAYAGLYFATTSILSYTVGVVIASMGSTSFWRACLGLLKLPIIYALLLALALNLLGWKLPGPLDKTVNLLADATIPSMLVLMGLQFQNARLSGRMLAIGLSTSLRLLVAPALAVLACLLLGLNGSARQAAILESAMPSAVTTTVLSTEYELEPTLVTSTVFFSTLLSPLILAPLLLYLRA